MDGQPTGPAHPETARKIRRAILYSGRDPDQLYRDVPREELGAWLAELRRSVDVKQARPGLRRRRRSDANLFTDWDRRFIGLVCAQFEKSDSPRPLTGKQLVMVLVLCDKLAAETALALEKDRG